MTLIESWAKQYFPIRNFTQILQTKDWIRWYQKDLRLAKNPRSVCCSKSNSVSFATGICSIDATDDRVHCDQAEEFGEKITRRGTTLYSPSANSNKRMLWDLMDLLVCKKVNITSKNQDLLIVVRLTAYSDRVQSIELTFSYELTPYPWSCIVDNLYQGL